MCQKFYYARSTTMTKILLISLYHFRLIILSWGLKRSFGDKLTITLSRNFVSVCNFMTVNDFYIRYGTLPHTFSHFCHTLGKLHTLWEVWESVRKLHQICVLKNQAKNQFEKFENNWTKKIHFFQEVQLSRNPLARDLWRTRCFSDYCTV